MISLSPRTAAKAFAGLTALVVVFQVCLAFGAPWGEVAMGGTFPGRFPPPMRAMALLQALMLIGVAVIVLSRAQVVLAGWRAARWLAWGAVGLSGVALILNLITPSALERLIWAPVALGLFLTSLRVALAPTPPSASAPT